MSKALKIDPRTHYAKKIQGLTHEQVVEEYRSTDDKAYRDFLAKEIEKPKAGETKEQRDKRAFGGAREDLDSAVPAWYSGVAGAGDVLSFGLADEMGGALDSLFGRRTYEQGVDAARRVRSEAKSANPKSFLGGQVAGGVAQSAPIIAFGGPAAAGLGGRMLAGAGEGAALGTAYGAGSGEGAQDRLWQAIEEGIIGMGLGGALPLVARGIGSAYRGARDALSNNGTVSKAVSKISDMMGDQRLTPDAARIRLQELGPEGMLADTSRGMQVEAAGTSARHPAAGDVMAPRLEARHEGMRQRVGAMLDDAFGPFQDPQAISDAVEATQRGTSPAYRLAREHVVDPEEAIEAIRDGMRTFGENSVTGRSLREFYRQLVDDAGNVIGQGNIVHGVRQELDALMRTGNLPNRGPFQRVRDHLDRVLKTQIPGFAEADRAWSGAERVQEAFDYGQRELMGQNQFPGQVASRWDRMAVPEREAARQGSRANIEMGTVAGGANTAGRLERTLDRNMNEQKLRPIVEEARPGAYDRMAQGIEGETTMRETNDLVQATRGSRTAPVLEAAENRWGRNEALPGLVQATGQVVTAGAAGGLPAAAASAGAQGLGAAGRRLMDHIRSVPPEVIREAGDLLTRQGAGAEAALRLVEQHLVAAGASQERAATIAGFIVNGLRGQTTLAAEKTRPHGEDIFLTDANGREYPFPQQ